MRKNLDILAERLYPDKELRDGSEKACRLIVATEQSIEAERQYNEALEEVKKFNFEHNGNFPGSFLAWKNDIIQSNLNDLINLTFGDFK